MDDKTSVTVGAMADYTSKQAHVFAKLEHELGEPGKIAVDVTGVELQKKFDVLEGIARTEVWNPDGLLVASFLQEGLVRPPRDWSPDVDPRVQLIAEMKEATRLNQLRSARPAKL